VEKRSNTFPDYLVTYACLNCRKAFKRQDQEGVLTLVCPNCGQLAHRTSRNFKAPKQSDLEQWSKVSFLLHRGFRFTSIRDSAGMRIPYPKTLEEAREFVEKYGEFAQEPIGG